jgi:hypothetical protein
MVMHSQEMQAVMALVYIEDVEGQLARLRGAIEKGEGCYAYAIGSAVQRTAVALVQVLDEFRASADK